MYPALFIYLFLLQPTTLVRIRTIGSTVRGATFLRQREKNATTHRCRTTPFLKAVCPRAENTATVTTGASKPGARITLMEDRGKRMRQNRKRPAQVVVGGPLHTTGTFFFFIHVVFGQRPRRGR